MAEGEGSKVGEASVDIVAVISVDEESLAAAEQQIQSKLGKDAQPASERRSRTKSQAEQVPVDAQINVKANDVQKKIKDALAAGDAFEIELGIDAPGLRAEITKALATPFQITFTAEMAGGERAVAVGASPSPSAVAGAPVGRGPVPDDVQQTMWRTGRGGGREKQAFVESINSVYRNINEALTNAGKPRFGSQALTPGNEIEKAIEMVDKFGSKLSDWVETKGELARPTGRGTVMDMLKEAGVGLKTPSVMAMTANMGGFGGDNRRSAEIFFKRLEAWARSTPITPQPAAAEAPAAAPVVHQQQAQAEAVGAAVSESIEKELSTARRAADAEAQQNLKFQPIDPEKIASMLAAYPTVGSRTGRATRTATGVAGAEGPRLTVPVEGTPSPATDEETEKRARRELGIDRANVRRLRGRGPKGAQVAGLTIPDLEPLLRLAEMGGFQDVYEQFGGKGNKESQGFGQLTAEDAGGQAALERLGKMKPGIKRQVGTLPGKFSRVGPTEAFIRTVIESMGVGQGAAAGDVGNITDQVRELLSTGSIGETIRKAVAQGSSPRRGSAGETKRGQGAPTMSGSGDLGKEARQLFEFIDLLDNKIANTTAVLDRTNADIERLSGSGRDVSGLEEHARSLAAQVKQFSVQRREAVQQQKDLTTTGLGPEAQARREAARLRGEKGIDSKEVVRTGVGLTAEEKLRSETIGDQGGLLSSRNIGERQRRLAESGELPSPEAIQKALLDAYLADSDRPEGETGSRTLRRIGFGPGGKAKKGQGLFGALAGQLPAEMGPSTRRESEQYIKDMIQAVLGDQGFLRGLGEEDVRRKESMATVRPGTTSRTIAHGLTGEGQYRFGPGQRAALESEIASTERGQARLGELDALIKRARGGPRQKLIGERSVLKDRYGGVDVNQLKRQLEESENRRVLEEAETRKSVGTRQKTMGRGKYVTGKESRGVFRGLGVAMPEEVRAAPFGAFNEQYAPGGSKAYYERIPASGAGVGGGAGAGGGAGGAAGKGMLTGGGGPAIPVFVTGGRLDSIGSVGGEGGGGGAPPAPPAGGGEGDETPGKRRKKSVAEIQAERDRNARIRAESNDFVAALRAVNVTGPAATKELDRAFSNRTASRERRYLSGAGQTPAEREFLSALVAANKPEQQGMPKIRILPKSTVSAEQRAMERRQREEARIQRIANPEGLATEGDISDEELAPIRARLRSVQRRIPRRGFGASLTDLITSAVGGSSFENQLEAGGRAEREAYELTTLFGQRKTLRTQRAGLTAQLPGATPARAEILTREITNVDRQLTGLGKAIDLSKAKFYENAEQAGKASTVLKSFTAAAAGSIVSTGIGAFTFGLGNVVATPILEGIGQVINSGLEKILGDPALKNTMRTSLAEATTAAAGRAGIGVAQVTAQAGLAEPTRQRISPELERAAAIESGNKALEQQIGLLKLAEDTRRRGAEAGVSQTLGGILGTFINGTMPAAEQIGNFLGGVGPNAAGVSRRFAGESQSSALLGQGRGSPGRGAPPGGLPGRVEQVDRLIGDLDKFRGRIKSVNEFLDKSGTSVVRFDEGLKYSKEQLDKQADSLQLLSPQLADLVRSGTVGITNKQTGGLATAEDAFRSIADALANAPKPEIAALLRQSEDQRKAMVQLEDRTRNFQLEKVIPQTNAIALAQQGFGTGGPQSAAAGINLGGLSQSDTKRLNADLGQTQKLYASINKEVDAGVAAAKEFVATTFSYDPKVGQDFAKSLDLSLGYAREIASIQIGIQTKQAAYQAAQFAYQINIAKRSLADARGLAGQITGESKNNLGVLEREQFFLQRRAQLLQLELSQRQINFQRSIAGFTAPGLTGEERAARIKEAKIEADFAQKQLNIQKQLVGLQGKSFTIQASRAVTDLVGQLGLLEKGRTLTLETAVAEKRIRVLTALQEKENKKVQTYYEAAVARTNDIFQLEAQLVSATGKALVTITNDVINAFTRTYKTITAAINEGIGYVNPNTDEAPGHALGMLGMDRTHAEGFAGTVQGATSFGKYGIAGEAGGEAIAIVRDPRKLMSPLGGGGGGTTIQIIVSGNKFTTQDEEDRMLRKITQAVKDAQGRDLALRGLRPV